MRHLVLRVCLFAGLSGALAAPVLAQPEDWETDAFLCRDLTLEPSLRIDACARALKASSLSAGIQVSLLSQRAMALDELGDYDRAVQDYDAAIVLDPDDPALYLNRGVAKIRGGNPAAAIPDYDKAISLKPDWHLPYFDRAVALSDLGQRAAALADYRRASDRKPDDAWIYVGEGDVHAAGGDAAAALAAYDHALELRPDLEQAHMRRARALLRLDRPQDAVAAMNRALASVDTAPGDAAPGDAAQGDTGEENSSQRPAGQNGKPAWRQLRAAAKFAVADFAGAVVDLAQARDLAPRNAGILRDLARAQLAAGDAAAADATAMRALQIAGNDADNVVLAGRVALAGGRTGEAQDLARRAITLRPGDAQARMLLALSLAPGGEAVGTAQAAADFAPQDAELQAIAGFLGAKSAAAPEPRAATQAEQMLAACIAGLEARNAQAATAAGAKWSLCHLAALRG